MFRVGATTIQKVFEMDLNGFELKQLLPAMDDNLLEKHPEWFPEGTVEDHRALMCVHSWLLRHEGMTILIDTGAGNNKSRPQQRALDHLQNPFLERLAIAGVRPEMVDYIVHTHVHSDHVGWNTILEEGRWHPTFPHAAHICSALEWDYGAALASSDEARIASTRAKAGFGEPVRVPVPGTFGDSMLPLKSSGQMRLVSINREDILPGLRFIPAPGHSIDHAAIELRSEGQKAIFGGDAMHHPVELYDPSLVSAFCEFPEAARRSRLALLHQTADEKAMYFSAHFSLSSAGWVTEDRDGFHWTFAEGE